MSNIVGLLIRGVVRVIDGIVDMFAVLHWTERHIYTRTVPCGLWHFDKGKPAERRDKVLMLDARNVYRKINRKIYDFTPEQLQNPSAIVLIAARATASSRLSSDTWNAR